jgi:pyruvate,water dikinase
MVQWRPGNRGSAECQPPLLQQRDVDSLLDLLDGVESRLGWCPDVEWTGCAERLTVLQARPVTLAAKDTDEQRAWYLTLRPGTQRLGRLCHRVVEELIPELKQTGERLAAENLDLCDDRDLAARIADRHAIVREWKKIYWDEFIPFAHGVRYLGLYYNDAVGPADPYEFVGLLRGEEMLAVQRNRTLHSLALQLRENRELERAIREALKKRPELISQPPSEWDSILTTTDGASRFLDDFRTLLQQFMDITFSGQRLIDNAPHLFHTVLELASKTDESGENVEFAGGTSPAEYEQRLLDAVGPDRHDEAKEVVRLGRLSWRLRDDDNILVARLESQLLRALQIAAARLRESGRLNSDADVNVKATEAIVAALRDPEASPVSLPPAKEPVTATQHVDTRDIRRQLIGQPAAPGFAAGAVRVIRGPQDLGAFCAGEVLVCDAIQPMMTHVVPLAAAVVERRGGMLIHGAIIARELGIACVNGVPEAAALLKNGQRVTVDGHLGIVTVGEPEFDLELG